MIDNDEIACVDSAKRRPVGGIPSCSGPFVQLQNQGTGSLVCLAHNDRLLDFSPPSVTARTDRRARRRSPRHDRVVIALEPAFGDLTRARWQPVSAALAQSVAGRTPRSRNGRHR